MCLKGVRRSEKMVVGRRKVRWKGEGGGEISIASKETSSCKEKGDMKVCAEGCRRDHI